MSHHPVCKSLHGESTGDFVDSCVHHALNHQIVKSGRRNSVCPQDQEGTQPLRPKCLPLSTVFHGIRGAFDPMTAIGYVEGPNQALFTLHLLAVFELEQ